MPAASIRSRCAPRTGKRVDILIPVEEGERYRLGGITFTGNKAYPNTKALRAQFALKDGDCFNSPLFGKGLEALRKAYGEGGYINLVGTPIPRVDEAKKLVYLEHRHRRRQEVLCLAHRVHGQHHHARQGHPPRTAGGRRPGVQQPPGGPFAAAPEPVELLRNAEGGAGRGDAAERGRGHGRPAAEAEGKGQELDRPERRLSAACRGRSSGSTTRPTTSSAWAKR